MQFSFSAVVVMACQCSVIWCAAGAGQCTGHDGRAEGWVRGAATFQKLMRSGCSVGQWCLTADMCQHYHVVGTGMVYHALGPGRCRIACSPQIQAVPTDVSILRPRCSQQLQYQPALHGAPAALTGKACTHVLRDGMCRRCEVAWICLLLHSVSCCTLFWSEASSTAMPTACTAFQPAPSHSLCFSST